MTAADGPAAAAPDPPPGAQAERTRLSWVRTSISVIVWAVVALRITVRDLGTVAVVVTVVCALAAMAVLPASRLRYRRAAAALDGHENPPDGRLLAVAGGIVVALSILVIGYATTS